MTEPLAYASSPTQWQKDQSHLNTLAICHYVWGGLTILFSSCGLFHVGMGIMFIVNPAFLEDGGEPPPAFVAYMFMLMGAGIVIFGWTTGILTIWSGRCIHQQRRRMFSVVMAGVNCLSIPIGTLLGVFTFIVLFRPTVIALYEQRKTEQHASPYQAGA